MPPRPRPRGAPPPWFKPAMTLLLSLPLLWLAGRWAALLADRRVPSLTADPVDYTINCLGLWSLRLLLFALAISPIHRLTGWQPIMSIRRRAGLFAFAYVVVHLTVYFALDLAFLVSELWKDVLKRRFILFGMAAFLCLLPLAVTSTRGWQKRLGGRRWRQLHRLVYAAGLLAVTHYALLVKGDQSGPWIHAAILGLLFLVRLLPRRAGGYLPSLAR